MAITAFFNSKIDVERPIRADDGAGNWTTTYAKLYTGLACCIQPRRGFEIVTHNKKQSEITHVMYVLPVSIRPDDRVNNGGTLYDVLDVRDVDLLGRFLTIDLKQVIV